MDAASKRAASARARQAVPALLLAAVVLAAVAGRAHAAPPAPERRVADDEQFRLHLAIDIPVLLLGAATGIVPEMFGSELPGPHCDPCDSSNVNGFDRWVIGRNSPGTEAVADAMEVGIPILGVAAGLLHYRHGVRAVATDMVIIAEAIILAGTTNRLLSLLARRPRPYMYVAGLRPDDRDKANAAWSFPSGHTALVFAATLSFAYLHTVRDHDLPAWLVWTIASAIALPMPILRLLSGEHFPTDVLAGMGIGIGYGLLVPMLHRVQDRAKTHVSFRLTPGGGALVGTF